MISFRHKGSFKKTEALLTNKKINEYINILNKYGAEGVKVLSEKTPIDTGKTASSWGFKVERLKTGLKLVWTNSNIIDNTPIAILIQYGHVTRNGGYVQGKDYINPAIKPIFNKLSKSLWKEVISV
jgi:hypothetical protein